MSEVVLNPRQIDEAADSRFFDTANLPVVDFEANPQSSAELQRFIQLNQKLARHALTMYDIHQERQILSSEVTINPNRVPKRRAEDLPDEVRDSQTAWKITTDRISSSIADSWPMRRLTGDIFAKEGFFTDRHALFRQFTATHIERYYSIPTQTPFGVEIEPTSDDFWRQLLWRMTFKA